jgi:hypothetical protein
MKNVSRFEPAAFKFSNYAKNYEDKYKKQQLGSLKGFSN